MNQTTSYWYSHPGFLLGLQITVGIICILSILGASLIILTYVLYKELRTTARLMLVHLSVADIMVAASHFAGLFYFQRYVSTSPDYIGANTDILCSTQGAVAMVGTIASFLWTLALATYMLMILVMNRPKALTYFLILSYISCWGIPIVLMVWFAVERFYGYSEGSDVAWCHFRHNFNGSSTASDVYPEVIGYIAWIFALFILLPVINIVTFCVLQCKLKRVRNSSICCQTRTNLVDLQLIFVPTALFLLRVWSVVVDFNVYIIHKENFLQRTDAEPVMEFLAGIGSSSQGLVNAVIFCLLTNPVRKKLFASLKSRLCCCLKCHCKPNNKVRSQELTETSITTGLLVTPNSNTYYGQSLEAEIVNGQSLEAEMVNRYVQ